MDRFEQLQSSLRERPARWLVTGCAGFIGSHLVQHLLELGQPVVGLDDLSTGRQSNLDKLARDGDMSRFRLVRGDIRDPAVCQKATEGVDYVLHQAALGSVPRSIEQPRTTHEVNVDGFVNVALAARDAGVRGFVYASSSSVYGDSEALPKREGEEGRPLSPYAASKRIDEVYAASFLEAYGLRSVGLRYFNVVGPRQDPNGVYAAVVPRWLSALASGEEVVIFGDGLTSRDFCPVENVVRANLLSAVAPDEAVGRAFNVGLGARTTLLELYALLRDGMAARGFPCADLRPRHEAPRKGDVRHSLADIGAATRALGWTPSVPLQQGLEQTMDAFVAGER
jgi:UDP-N-acetylglucosamine 4-epimerase